MLARFVSFNQKGSSGEGRLCILKAKDIQHLEPMGSDLTLLPWGTESDCCWQMGFLASWRAGRWVTLEYKSSRGFLSRAREAASPWLHAGTCGLHLPWMSWGLGNGRRERCLWVRKDTGDVPTCQVQCCGKARGWVLCDLSQVPGLSEVSATFLGEKVKHPYEVFC